MTSQLKLRIAKNFYSALHGKVNIETFDEFMGRFSLLRNDLQIGWRVKLTEGFPNSLDPEEIVNSQRELLDSKIITSCKVLAKTVCVDVDHKKFIKDTIDSDPTKLGSQCAPKKLIFEFSSPNIAKPFHCGHLRSTNIGNVLSNIKKKLGNNVVRINYLGDWGTQLGMIQLGMNTGKFSDEDLQKTPLDVLYKAYVLGNAEAEKDMKLYEEAKKIFYDLEFEAEEITQKWNKYKEWTVTELNAVYNRLGVSFDEWNWESDYKRKKADFILKMLDEKGVLSLDEMNRKVAVLGDIKIPLLKSDGTTLYVLRDLMAVRERRLKHAFDEIYYVVDLGQSEHFWKLFKLCSELKFDEGVKMHHLKFGRIEGMSTRKGTGVFLSDILDEARERFYQIQVNSKNTKISLLNKDTADILAVSAVVINDLRRRRLTNYKFSWNEALQVPGDSGPALQYAHCRLCNLETESGKTAALDCDPEALLEPQAVSLIKTMARYEESLRASDAALEPSILVFFTFELLKAINSAYRELKIKASDDHVASQRLLMFNKARQLLNECMRLLGMKPLDKM